MLGDSTEDRAECSESQGIVIRNPYAVARRLGSFQNDVAADLAPLSYCRFRHKRSARREPETSRKLHAHAEDYVAYKAGANPLSPGAVEKERRGCLKHVLAQLLPRVTFGEDALREAFGAITPIGLLREVECHFSHPLMIWHDFA
jgi:hypothetical protein